MGYNLHITRGDWLSDHAGKLSFEEWLSLAAKDPELIPDGEAAVEAKTRAIRNQDTSELKSKTARFIWGHDAYTFYHFNNSVRVKGAATNLDVLRKMLQIAEQLGARVQGDEGEYYQIKDDNIIVESD